MTILIKFKHAENVIVQLAAKLILLCILHANDKFSE